MILRKTPLVLAAILAASSPAEATVVFPGNQQCPDLPMNFAPMDYRTASKAEREIVENFHFTPKVANLQAGESSAEIAADIAYTLRAFPNHPRALYAMAEIARRQKTAAPEKAWLSVECWFTRALRFRPDDAQVRLVYGIELQKDGNSSAAIKELERSVELDSRNGNAHYNLGLAYLTAGRYDEAREQAKKAAELGYTLSGLRQKLQAAGKWN
jgi:Flp pilus assembly protein TadD